VLQFELNRLEFKDVDFLWGIIWASSVWWLKLRFLVCSCSSCITYLGFSFWTSCGG
jgi:hypothetical protein